MFELGMSCRRSVSIRHKNSGAVCKRGGAVFGGGMERVMATIVVAMLSFTCLVLYFENRGGADTLQFSPVNCANNGGKNGSVGDMKGGNASDLASTITGTDFAEEDSFCTSEDLLVRSNLRGSGLADLSFPQDLRPIVIAGPSGVGKGTLINKVIQHFNKKEVEHFGFSVSHTTRQPRPGEVDGAHYHFTTVEDISRRIDQNEFIEHNEVHGNIYGTSYDAVQSVTSSGRICILDIDIQGVKGVKESDLVDPHYIFVAPPSMELLEKRLRDRGTETESAIEKRLSNASKEVQYGTAPGNFDHVVVNDDLDFSFSELTAVLEEWYPHLAI